MKHFYMITNENKDRELKTTKEIQALFVKKGAECIVGTECGEIPYNTECILVLGGDGTLLQAARDTFEKDIPLIGVNLGTLGFMAEVELQHIEEAVDILIHEDVKLETRMMLDGSVHVTASKGEVVLHALNDIVVTRQGSLCILSFDVYVNGQFLTRYQADGVIIATPTGSTGYNMSAGGPIAQPEAELLLLTPICPHSLSTRSIILSATDTVEIRISHGRNGEVQKACVNFDGSVGIELSSGDRITVKKSEQTTKFAKIRQSGFLENLQRKMK